ncbi:DUF362 domain-containing protein [Candidatus Aminicenantes bacterium AH-873-B07]|nr:DUF362 domain-containing protein [Candidatus Aminicenantes bacterium AH-873-B07]
MKKIRISLKVKFITYVTLLIIFLVSLILFIVEKREVNTIFEESKNRGLLIAKNIADLNLKRFLFWDKKGIKENIENQVDEKLLYIIFYDKENKPFVATNSVKNYRGVYKRSYLKGDITPKDKYFNSLTLRRNGKPFRVLELEIPIFAGDSRSKWGSLKIGLSLEEMYAEIKRTRLILLLLGGGGIIIGIKERNIIIWDRTNKELKGAGYRLNYNGSGIRIFGTDTRGINYEYNLTIHRNIGSRFSKIQSKLINKSISLAILKDHGIAGITGVMKNYFGAIHNPNKYHDTNCDPYIAELSEVGLIKNKNKLSILDGLIVQYHRGPSYHSQWAEKCECFILSTDPVASDFIGWQLIEKIRKKKGLPTLEEKKRKPYYLFTAEKMGLGKANLNEIQLIEYEV